MTKKLKKKTPGVKKMLENSAVQAAVSRLNKNESEFRVMSAKGDVAKALAILDDLDAKAAASKS
jgi:hypothetical protein